MLDGAPPSAVHIREVRGGGVCLVGAAEKEVTCKAEMAAVLEQARPAYLWKRIAVATLLSPFCR